MRIGLDAKRAFCNNSGLGNYSRMFIRAMLTRFPEHTFFLFTPMIRDEAFYDEIRKMGRVGIITPQSHFARRFHFFWRRFKIGRIVSRLDLDVFHGLSQELPRGLPIHKIRKVVTIHDMIAFHAGGSHEWYNAFFYKLKIKHAVKSASAIVAISKQTAHELQSILPLKGTTIQVIYQPVAPEFFKRSDEAFQQMIRAKYRLPETYILQTGNMQPRKNHKLTLKTLQQSAALHNLHFVIVGKPGKNLKKIKNEVKQRGLESRVHFLFEVPASELPALYQMASCVVYPSLMEGYGLPIVEAMASYVPVITTNGGCFEEAGGQGAWYISPNDTEAMATTLQTILTKGEQVTKKLQEGLHLAGINTAPKMADAYMQVYVG